MALEANTYRTGSGRSGSFGPNSPRNLPEPAQVLDRTCRTCLGEPARSNHIGIFTHSQQRLRHHGRALLPFIVSPPPRTMRRSLSSPCVSASQPKQINEIKDFLLTARRKDAKCTLSLFRSTPDSHTAQAAPLVAACGAGAHRCPRLFLVASGRLVAASARIMHSISVQLTSFVLPRLLPCCCRRSPCCS